jgi:D-threo-aldose 1-dehydrogenase
MSSKVLHRFLPVGAIPLGFGSGGLLHGLNYAESLRLLDTAIDCGITYFDTARMYGFGRAESILGKLLSHRRDRIIIATKAGILPASRSIPVRVLNRGANLLRRCAPHLATHIPAPQRAKPQFGYFRRRDFQKSVETSLRELRTDYIDILLLHECTLGDVHNELLDYLHDLRLRGIIRAFGLATGIDDTIKIAEANPVLNHVLQISSNIWNMNITRLPARPCGLTITHSSLTSRFHALSGHLSRDPSIASKWKRATQVDPSDKSALAELLIAHALHSNPDGLVLFFSTKPENIRACTQVAKSRSIDVSQIIGLNNFLSSDEGTALALSGSDTT